ncbi:hypothetical protein K2P97_00990 [bacterium]|nr:hypothetical protein [bacterium]
MNTIIQTIIRLIILACLVGGVYLVVKTGEEKTTQKKAIEQESKNPKVRVLKKFLADYGKPERVEIFNYTKKFDQDVNEILNTKISTDPVSEFYITIQFFTDENDEKAPLVAQIRFLDVTTDNLKKEVSINLEENTADAKQPETPKQPQVTAQPQPEAQPASK